MSADHLGMAAADDERGTLAARLVARLLPETAFGRLSIVAPDGQRFEIAGTAPGPVAAIRLHRWRAMLRLLAAGHIGMAEGFIAGDWSASDLPQFFAWALANETYLAKRAQGSALARLVGRVTHRSRANTRLGSRRNIAAHYDLGNAFYRRWLDRGMNYSSALYGDPGQSLDSAQDAKLERIVSLLDLAGGDRVLEIGIGWGALAERLAGRHRCTVTGITLSTEQLAYARDRLRDAGVAADLRLQDYRDVDGRYDRIVSIEMLEAVGEAYWPRYFETLRARLKPGGTCVLQVITIAPERFERYRRDPDFIQRYVFPGGMLPTVHAIAQATKSAGLHLAAHESFGLSYAYTLREWRHRFRRHWPEIAPLGFDTRFRRMWDYYLAYCEAGFLAGSVDVGLFVLRG